MLIFPSIISCDLLNLERTIKTIDDHVDGYHIDVMDDHFVPNLTWGPAFITALRGATQRPFQIHLMVDNPRAWIDRIQFKKEDSFIPHVEAFYDEKEVEILLNDAHAAGWRVGLALNPPTPIAKIMPYMHLLDEILFMSVNPGFSGQSFIDVSAKVRQFKDAINFPLKSPRICMDGGIGVTNIGMLSTTGVQLVGAAAAIFSGADLIKNIENLRCASIASFSAAK